MDWLGLDEKEFHVWLRENAMGYADSHGYLNNVETMRIIHGLLDWQLTHMSLDQSQQLDHLQESKHVDPECPAEM